jgi:DnaJ-class molecular chaperone with C-terminal Zn finger domain
LYAVLGVSPLATQEEIRHAYRKLVRRFHPDSGSEEASAERFQEVQEAYRVLGDWPVGRPMTGGGRSGGKT